MHLELVHIVILAHLEILDCDCLTFAADNKSVIVTNLLAVFAATLKMAVAVVQAQRAFAMPSAMRVDIRVNQH